MGRGSLQCAARDRNRPAPAPSPPPARGASSTMPTTVISGTGMAVPDRVVTNDDLAALMDTSDEWIRTRTGIEERRW